MAVDPKVVLHLLASRIGTDRSRPPTREKNKNGYSIGVHFEKP